MEKSVNINELATAFSNFQNECPTLTLNKEVKVATRTGSSYSFKYATLSNIHEVVKPILSKHGLSITQIIEQDGMVTTVLMHSSGQFISGIFGIRPVDSTPQSWGSVITYNKRYSLSAILGISSEEDDDANSASGNTVEVKAEDNRPWLTEAQFNSATTRLAEGEDILDKVLSDFKMKREYKQQLMTFKK
jgi:hypothetical protein